MTPIRKANIVLAKRYIEMIDKTEGWYNVNHELMINARKLCEIIIDENIEMYDDKSSRWIGYIQGILIVYSCTTIETERNFSRTLFHAAYEEMSLPIPGTLLA